MYPNILTKAINCFKKFDGIGEKSAERLSLSLLEMSREEVDYIINTFNELKETVLRCKICGHIPDNEVCSICSNKFRNNNLICVVEDYLGSCSEFFCPFFKHFLVTPLFFK